MRAGWYWREVFVSVVVHRADLKPYLSCCAQILRASFPGLAVAFLSFVLRGHFFDVDAFCGVFCHNTVGGFFCFVVDSLKRKNLLRPNPNELTTPSLTVVFLAFYSSRKLFVTFRCMRILLHF